ncbi:eukaryotic translation initiation factor 3 subunit J [Zychaea mexicana]|uniref:eukaryotic translation initiation factor 3 subunit J n=1 Tax=Zychaea mexicana TaxID=64656 RepID=UPI0022FE0233|nr:eukaryotic translation initiation factor 3 subunit J [Zychaea mexicana]KAI9492130.1 eukaryotic translation initiation factor 3 subunit J [Zychaea mexicana]
MSDWEDEKEFEVAVPKKSKWDDEDVEDDVKDDWEEESSDEEQKEEKKLPPVRKKVPLAQKIAEKKAAEEERKKALEAKKAEIRAREEETEEDAFERKQRMRQLEVEADMNSATDLFSGVSVSKEDKNKPIEEYKPKTRVEYNEYAKRLAEIILANSKSANYGAFLDTLVREIAVPCKDMDIRKAASSLTAMANEKQRQAKEATKTKKKGKPQLAAAGKSATLDEGASYRDVYDDFDDFM